MTDVWKAIAEIQHNLLKVLEKIGSLKKDVEALKSETVSTQDTIVKLHRICAMEVGAFESSENLSG